MTSPVGLDSKSLIVAVLLLPPLADIDLWLQRSCLNVAGSLRIDLLAPFEGSLTDFPLRYAIALSSTANTIANRLTKAIF